MPKATGKNSREICKDGCFFNSNISLINVWFEDVMGIGDLIARCFFKHHSVSFNSERLCVEERIYIKISLFYCEFFSYFCYG